MPQIWLVAGGIVPMVRPFAYLEPGPKVELFRA
jgi:hypothetical protein